MGQSSLSLYKGSASRLIDSAVAHKEHYEISIPQLAYIMATSEHETAHTHEPVEEANWMSETWRRNNLHYYPWHGRGFVQITWEENYQRAQDKLGIGTYLTDDPDRAMEPSISAEICVCGMCEGWFTGKKLSDYINDGKTDYTEARRIVNGTDCAEQIAAIAVEYEKLIVAVGGYEAYKRKLNP